MDYNGHGYYQPSTTGHVHAEGSTFNDQFQQQQQGQPRRADSNDSFGGRFNNGSNIDLSVPPPARPMSRSQQYQQHPAALQASSAMYLPPSTQLREDRLAAAAAASSDYGQPGQQPSAYMGDDGVTISPFDSISNVGDRDHHQNRFHRKVSSYGGETYLAKDPYAAAFATSSNNNNNIKGSRRHSKHASIGGTNDPYYANNDLYSKNYTTRPRSGSGGGDSDDQQPRMSTSELPLMYNAAGHAGYRGSKSYSNNIDGDSDEPGSIVDGDTIVSGSTHDERRKKKKKYRSRSLTQEEIERGILSESYPPPPRYDTPEDEKNQFANTSDPLAESSKNEGVLGTLKGKKRKSGKRPNVWLRQIRDTTPLEDKIKNHKRGIGVQDRPWACWVMAVILVIVFIVELVKSSQKTGKAISTSPFNYMIGPSSEMLINLGARFTACMRPIPEIENTPFLCLNQTGSSTSSISTTCTLEQICGTGGFGADGKPNQTFRFFTPLWLHVGVVHLLLNGLALLTSSALVEKQMGTLKFLILYVISGVFGFVLGGNFALAGLASMGASGAIFGTHAAVLVDLIWHWKLFDKPGRMLLALGFEVIVGFGLGYIPGIDNFSHIGGFAIGILLSIVLIPAIHLNETHRIGIYCARLFAFIGACVMFGVLVNNFFTSDPNSACEWCRYLSCWPTNSNNHCKGTGLTMTETTTSTTPSSSSSGTVGSQTNSNVSLALITLISVLLTRKHFQKRD